MTYTYLADVIVAVHVAFVSFVLLGQVAILLGVVLRWDWVRNFWFRLAHLAAIAFVALEAVLGVACPLTVWEDELRERAGETVTEGTFIGRFLHHVLFYNADPWVFTTAYVLFALVVAATFVLAPPRRPRAVMTSIWRPRTSA